ALLLAAVGFFAVIRLARPAEEGIGPVTALVVSGILVVVAGLAVLQLTEAPAAIRTDLVLATSALVSPWLIALPATPFIAGLFWAGRGLAPTQLRAAGFATGLAAGGLAAWVYAFHCPESGVPFIAIWYTAGIAIAGLIGLLLGPRLLRW